MKILTLQEVADYLRVHPSTIYRLAKKGRMPAFKIGGEWRFNLDSVDKWMAEAEGSARAEMTVKARLDDAKAAPVVAEPWMREDETAAEA